MDFVNFATVLKKTELLEKFELLDKREFTLMEMRKKESPVPCATPIYILSMPSTIWNISIGQLGLAAWLCSLPAPAHLLISQTWETEKSLRFLSNN